MRRPLCFLLAAGPALTGLLAPAPAAAQAFAVDRAALAATCAQGADLPPHPMAAEIVSVSEDQWARFGRGRVRETSSEPVVITVGGGQDTAVQAALGWEAVWGFWEVAGQDRLPSYPYDVRRKTTGFELVRTPAWRQLEAIRTAVSDPMTAKALSAAVKRASTPELPWSAVFVSSVMIQAGLDRARFTPAAAHAGYIQAAVEGNARADATYAYRACDPATTKARVGDVICTTRTGGGPRSFETVLRGIERLSGGASADARRFGFESHCDVVTAVTPAGAGGLRIESIGGNVGDTVAKTIYTLSGPLLPTARPRKTWIALLQLVPEPPPPAPEPEPVPEVPAPESSDPAAPVDPTAPPPPLDPAPTEPVTPPAPPTR